jgi:hypothetical protein
VNKAGDMKFTLRQLTYFIAAAETGSITSRVSAWSS